MQTADREHFGVEDDLPAGTVADSFTLEFCEHGFGRLLAFRDGSDEPFACLHLDPDLVIEVAGALVRNIKCEGQA